MRLFTRVGCGVASVAALATVAVVASTAQAQSSPPPAVRTVVQGMIDDCRDIGGRPSPDALTTTAQEIDLTGDGVSDWVIVGGPNCEGGESFWSGSGGTQASVFVGDGRGDAFEAGQLGLFTLVYSQEDGRWTAWAGVGGERCGQRTANLSRAEYDSCLVPWEWNASRRTFDLAAPSRKISYEQWGARARHYVIGRWAEGQGGCGGRDVIELRPDGTAYAAGSEGTWSGDDYLTLTLPGQRGPVELTASVNRIGAEVWDLEWFVNGQSAGLRPMRRCDANTPAPGVPALAVDDETQIRTLIASIYDAYAGGARPSPDAVFTPEVAMAAEYVQDPFCDCARARRGDVTWRADSVRIDGDAARANVAVMVRGARMQPTSIELRRTGFGWRVSDVRTPQSGSWADRLPAVTAAASAGAPAAAAGNDEAAVRRLLDEVYGGFNGGLVGSDEDYLTTDLAAQFRADAEIDGMGYGNALCQCQDLEETRFQHRITTVRVNGDTAKATVSITLFGDDWNEVPIDLARTSRGWRISGL